MESWSTLTFKWNRGNGKETEKGSQEDKPREKDFKKRHGCSWSKKLKELAGSQWLWKIFREVVAVETESLWVGNVSGNWSNWLLCGIYIWRRMEDEI